MNLRQALTKKLSTKEMELVKTAYDVVGDIAILEIDDKLRKRDKVIGETLLALQSNIKVVTKKVGMHEGEFRIQKLKVIAGEKRLETEYKENGCRFRLNPEEVYFSPRLSTERKRISDLIRKGESVLVMFSGAGPYPVVFSKNTQAASITGVEKNPLGHKWAEINGALNKCTNITFRCGDAKRVVPKLGTFDRVLMPLPRGGEAFLDVAINATKKGGMIHFYDFLHESELPEAKKKVKEAADKANRRFRTSLLRKTGSSGPRFYRICLDFWVY
jgi:tRNA (guanine37-N1)-methyltransferase